MEDTVTYFMHRNEHTVNLVSQALILRSFDMEDTVYCRSLRLSLSIHVLSFYLKYHGILCVGRC